MKKLSRIKIVAGFALILALTAAPASAAESPFSSIISQFEQYLGAISSYFENLAKPQLDALSSGLGEDVTSVVSDVTGALGIPDPFAARDQVQEKVAGSTVYAGETATNAVDSQITRASAASTLSKDGQTQMQQEAQNAKTAVERVGQNAQTAEEQASTAESATSTQDVVKQMALQNAQLAKQQAENSALFGAINTNMQRQIEAQNLGNVNLANVSTAVSGANQGQNFSVLSQGQENFRRGASASLF